MKEFPNEYNSKDIEEKWRKYWEKEKIYSFNKKNKGKIYSVDTPPPTVSGKMHLGHAFGYSQQDFLVRFKRMAGYNVYYPFGTDDNGLPTERLVERLKNVKSTKMPRPEFVELC
jgi:valyl-tRNA synthetase